jgi:hypothetical protein
VEGVEILSEAIFTLHSAPELVFKIADNSGFKDMEERWGHAKRAAEICKQQNLDLLILPRQTLFKLRIKNRIYHVITEERLPLTNNLLIHAHLYEKLASRLEPTLRQLVAFIAASGFRDVDFRNIPILDQALVPDAEPKIALVDLENCGYITELAARETYRLAFFGNDTTIRGLFRCVAPQNFDAVQEAASQHQIDLESWEYERALRDRCYELTTAQRIRERVADISAYEREVKRMFKTFATSLSIGVPSLKIFTEPFDPFV